MKKWQARVGLLVVALIWGIGYIATDESIQHVSVFQMQIYRFGISSLVLLVIFFKKFRKIRLRAAIYGVLLGLVFFIATSMQNAGLETTTVSKNAFLVVFNIVFVPIIMYLCFKVKVKTHYYFGVFTMIIGFFILIFINFDDLSGSFANLAAQANLVVGDYLTLGASFIFAVQIVMIGLFVQKEDAIVLVTIELLTSCILSIVYCLFNGEAVFLIGSPEFALAFLPILFLGVSGCISFGGQIYIQKYLSASDVALIFSTESLFAAFFSVLFGFEPFTMNLLIGAIVITLGIIWAETGFKFKDKK